MPRPCRLLLVAFLTLACASRRPAPPGDGAIEVAVTVDDLPRHGPALPGREPIDVARAMLSVLERHGVPRVYGFVNGVKLEQVPADRAVLEAWVAAGHPLGNHEWAHQDLHEVGPARFIDGIRRNEAVLRALRPDVPERDWRVFRYPCLHEGRTLAERDAVRTHLMKDRYRLAPVTIDPYDVAYNAAYARCLGRQDAETARALREQYLAEARARLAWAAAQGRALQGRPVRQVLLIHLGMLDADTLEQLLTDYERAGVRWIPLERALEDPAYAANPNGTFGGNFLLQLSEARGLTPPPAPLTPLPLLERVCR